MGVVSVHSKMQLTQGAIPLRGLLALRAKKSLPSKLDKNHGLFSRAGWGKKMATGRVAIGRVLQGAGLHLEVVSLRQNRHAQVLRFRQLGAGFGARQNKVSLFGDRP